MTTRLKLTFMVTTPDGNIVCAGDAPIDRPTVIDVKAPGQFEKNCDEAGAAMARYIHDSTKDALVPLPMRPVQAKPSLQ